MKNVYFLKTCNTCTRIINELNLSDDFKFQEIKSEPLTAKQVDELAKLAGSYEALFSKRAKLYKEMSLKDQNLTEKDFKHYLLEHYTFLSRPVIVINDKIFVGNSKKTIEAAKEALNE
ncbi:arsenate reductase family protein [Mesoflavibacter zeaxanthinifaciens]|uniref:arsenate reductase family protein n=1 Tax=Mesoflavibacter zeaxanthinifaciens TaxID=393060 RepID=UPI0026EC9588|nr:ArsC/Spx/MgsR family protein [Mesoflavibacter zeaxanthinifaciens]